MINGLRRKSWKLYPFQQSQIICGVTLTKQTKDLCKKNFKSLKKEIGADIKRQTDLPCSWISRTNIVKMAILSKSIYRFNIIPMEIATQFFTDLERTTLKLHMEKQNKTKNQG